jgi:GNAT superfamily N-acetyltransferase
MDDSVSESSGHLPINSSNAPVLSGGLTLIPADPALRPLITYLAVGEDEGLEQQLITKSRQPNILQYTPKDAAERFGNPTMLKAWRAKGREIHWLLGSKNNQDRDLAGIMWYGASVFPLDIPLPEIPRETLAIRIYEGYAGHGLARAFMTQSLKIYLQRKQVRGEPITGLWLQTDVTNPAAIAAYTKFGYNEVGRNKRRVTMVLPATQLLAIAAHG